MFWWNLVPNFTIFHDRKNFFLKGKIMAIIKPFRALRPAPEVASSVASVPYDVVNTEEAKQLSEKYPCSFLRITRSEVELPGIGNVYAPEVYQKAKENLERIKAEAPLLEEETPALYIYAIEMNGRIQNGIAATYSVDDYDNDVILKHEKTRKEKEDDRTNHIITTLAQTGPVFLTYRGVQAVNEIVAKVKQEQKPVYDFTAEDGIRHSVWVVPTGLEQGIIDAIGGVEHLYIADGHHRAKSASRAREEMKKQNPQHTGNEEYNYFIGVLFPAEELYIMPYNRVVKDLNGLTTEGFLAKVQEFFVIEKSAEKEPVSTKTFGMYFGNEWYKLTLKSVFLDGDKIKGTTTVGESLDVSILQNYLLQPILGIEDPRTDKRIDFVGGIRGTQELEKLVGGGSYAVAFSLYPVTLQDLMNISDAGEIMPPKSTWFEPKLRDGLLVHCI